MRRRWEKGEGGGGMNEAVVCWAIECCRGEVALMEMSGMKMAILGGRWQEVALWNGDEGVQLWR